MPRARALLLALMVVLSSLTVLAVPTSASASGRCIDYVYGRGGSGQCVKNIQLMANGITSISVWGGHSSGCGYLTRTMLVTDGSFGTNTYNKIRSIQDWGCDSIDGRVGRQTWNTLCFYASSRLNDQNATYHKGYLAALSSGCKPSDSYMGPWPYSTY